MSNVLLTVLSVVCIIGFLFAVLVASVAIVMAQKNQDEIRDVNRAIGTIESDLQNYYEFAQVSADAISSIGLEMNAINERTGWMDGLDGQITGAFGENKNGKES